MEKTPESRSDSTRPDSARPDSTRPDNAFLQRHLSQLKILTRLVEHELDSEGREVTMDREVVESMLDTLEIFIEDLDGGAPAKGGARGGKSAQAEKPSVTRLN